MSETTEPQAGTETAPPAAPTPPWGSDDQFDATKAWKLIEDLRSDKAKLAERPALTPEQTAKLAEYDRLEQASKTELQRETEEKTRWQTEAERWRTQSVTNRIEALAGQDFADPSDAATALSDPSKYVDAGGVVDEVTIKADLAALLDSKPHWRRPDGVPSARTPAPNRAQGSSAGGAPAGTPADAFAALFRAQTSS